MSLKNGSHGFLFKLNHSRVIRPNIDHEKLNTKVVVTNE